LFFRFRNTKSAFLPKIRIDTTSGFIDPHSVFDYARRYLDMPAFRGSIAQLSIGCLLLTAALPSKADFTPIPLQPGSFNADIIVERTAPAPLVPGAYTTASMDTGTGNTGFSWYEQGYYSAAATTGLPHPGTTFVDQSALDHSFTMAPSYTANNAILLDSTLTSAGFRVTSPAAYAKLSLLESGGHNGVTFSYAVRHQDGTREVGTNSIPDWFNGATPAFTANGRIDVGSFAFDNVNNNNPRLYALDLTLTNLVSPVTNVSFSYVTGAGHAAIMALSGGTTAASTFAPIAITGYNHDIVIEAAAPKPGALVGYTTATMESGTANNNRTWYEAGYLSSPPSTGLPAPGSIVTNIAAPDHRFTMSPSYAANNALMLSTALTSASLKPSSPAPFRALSFLTSAANGAVTNGCTVYHADGTMESNYFVSLDWFNNAPKAFVANGRVNVSARTVDSVNGGNPRLYAVDVALTNQSSPITNIVLKYLGGASVSANSAIFAVSGGFADAVVAGDDFNADTAAGTAALQQWYNASGLWDTTGWWNAANCVEAIENALVAANGGPLLSVLTNTFNHNSAGNFINSFYDDEGWWANAWIRAYDLTGNISFLNMAKTIFNDMKGGWDPTCGGGIWWQKPNNYKNAIANELFLLVAIRLHQRTPGDPGANNYLYWGTNEWSWFKNSGMINPQNLINDGLSSACVNNGQTTWTYNQGVILGGLTDLYKSTGDSSYLTQAIAIADAATSTLVDTDGVLREPCELTGCGGGDVPQFKGIFIRNLAYLNDVVRKPSYSAFLLRNAHAVWFNDRNPNNQLGLKWDGDLDSVDAARQSSALMPLSVVAEPVTPALPFAKGSGGPAFNHAVGFPAGTLGWACDASTAAGWMQHGPYVATLPPGPHFVHFHCSVDTLSISPAGLAQLHVRRGNGSDLAVSNVLWSCFSQTNQDFRLLFTNTIAGDPLEFRVFWNAAPGAPVFTIGDVTIDGLDNWTAANLVHDIGRLDGVNCWDADPVRDAFSGYLTRGPGIGKIPPGNYSVQFEVKVDNFNWDNAIVASLAVVNVDSNLTVTSRNLTRNQFPNILFQNFTLNFDALPGQHYDFRTFWYRAANAPRLTQRAVLLRPGTNSFFASSVFANNTFAADVIGVPGRTYTIQTATDLLHPIWSSAGAITVPLNLGTATFKGSILAPNSFYRLSFP
jgi:predicted alpha-1,6-mannanase (GH76 family)